MKKVLLTAAVLCLSASCVAQPNQNMNNPVPPVAPTNVNASTASTGVTLGLLEPIFAEQPVCSHLHVKSGKVYLLKEKQQAEMPCFDGIGAEFEEYELDVAAGTLQPTGRLMNGLGVPSDRSADRLSPNGRYDIRLLEDIQEDPAQELGKVYLKDMQTGQETLLLEGTFKTGYEQKYTQHQYGFVGWSPDSRWIVFSNSNVPVLDGEEWKLEYGALDLQSTDRRYVRLGQAVVAETMRPPVASTWSPDSTRVAIDDDKRFYDVTTKEELFVPRLSSLNNAIVWSPDSQYALVTISDRENFDLQLVDREGEVVRSIITGTDLQDFPAATWLSPTEFAIKSGTDGLRRGTVASTTLTDIPGTSTLSSFFLATTSDKKWMVIFGGDTMYRMAIK